MMRELVGYPMKKKLLIFDFDGTLAKTHELTRQILVNYFKNRSLALPPLEDLQQMSAQEFFKKYKINSFRLYFLAKEAKLFMKAHSDTIEIFEGLESCLSLAHQKGWDLRVCSSNSKEVIEKVLKKAGVYSLFTDIQADKGLLSKNKALLKMSREKMNADSSYYVGDELRDIDAAHRVGIKAISVGWGFQSGNALKAANPEYFLKNISEFSNLLQSF